MKASFSNSDTCIGRTTAFLSRFFLVMKVFWLWRRRGAGQNNPKKFSNEDSDNNNYRHLECESPATTTTSSRGGVDGRPPNQNNQNGGAGKVTGRVTKRGYHKLSADTPTPAATFGLAGVSESEGSYSETDCSDCDKDDESDYDESLTCNVCERSFPSTRILTQHQQRKRHFGCSVCDSLFPSLMALEEHKEALEHWSAEEGNPDESGTDGPDTDDEMAPTEELERLL